MAKRVLVAALNWGLGHAARSVPVIRELQQQGADLLLASDGRAARLWGEEFPDLPLLTLPGYGIRYPSDNLSLHLIQQAPAMLKAIRSEQRLVRKWVAANRIDAIISDHRYGCFHPAIPSVFICHQMYIKAPNRLAELVVNTVHRHWLRRFNYHWVPDWEEAPGLAGELAHTYHTERTQFIGPLSRFRPQKLTPQRDYLVVLSGPEPQRSHLEALIRQQLPDLPGTWLVVGGKPEAQPDTDPRYRAFAGGSELEQLLRESRYIICRSGYSSIMDLVALGKPALLIPTPGQTEQEYLARLCSEKQQFISCGQKDLILKTVLPQLHACKSEPQRPRGQSALGTAVSCLLK